MTQITQSLPIPLDIRKELPDPHTPWGISNRIFKEMQAGSDASLKYKKCQVLPSDAEWRFVWRYFHHDKPTTYSIKCVHCIHERHQTQRFEMELSQIEREADKFQPNWSSMPRAKQRAAAIERWRSITQIFSPFKSIEGDGRRRNWSQTKILPLWHGTDAAVCNSISESGFVYFGKHTIGAGNSDPKSTDEGYFGSGIYFTDSARYAADIYSKGHLLLAWVSMREPLPVVGDPAQQDMQTLKGQGAYGHYNAHYVPVISTNPSDPTHPIYYPCQQDQQPAFDELVIFQKAQALNRFWIELEVELPYLMQLSDEPQCVAELNSYLLKILANDYVDRDRKLRKILNHKLAELMQKDQDDDLEADGQEFFSMLLNLLDLDVDIRMEARNKLVTTTTLIEAKPDKKHSNSLNTLLHIAEVESSGFNLRLQKPTHETLEHFFQACCLGDLQKINDVYQKQPAVLTARHRYEKNPYTLVSSLDQFSLMGSGKLSSTLNFFLRPRRYYTYGFMGLCCAILKKHFQIADWLVEKDPNLVEPTDEFLRLSYGIDEMKWFAKKMPILFDVDCKKSLLAGVFNSRSTENIKWLCDSFPAVLDWRNGLGDTPLHIAAAKEHQEVLMLIISYKPELLLAKNNHQLTAEALAKRDKRHAVAEFLFKQTQQLLKQNHLASFNPNKFFAACKADDTESVQYWCKQDPERISLKTDRLETALHHAAAGGNLELAQWLVVQESSLFDCLTTGGRSPAHYAAFENQFTTLKWFIEQRPELLVQATREGRTLLHEAAAAGSIEIMEWLVEEAPDLIDNAPDYKDTPLHASVQSGQLNATKWLVKRNPNLVCVLGSRNQTARDDAHFQQDIAKWLDKKALTYKTPSNEAYPQKDKIKSKRSHKLRNMFSKQK